MGKRFILAVFAVLITSTTALAQLGPKDGADLSPTDLNRIKVGQPAPEFSLEDVNGKTIKVLAEREPGKLPWKDLGVQVAVESTGFFTSREGGGKKGATSGFLDHISKAGASGATTVPSPTSTY